MELRSQDDWPVAIATARDYIIREAASQRLTVNYTQLVSWINARVRFSIVAHSTAMDLLLEDVAREEFLANRPMLTSLVVQQGSRAMPGPGLFRIATELAETPIRTRAEWVRIRDEVWGFYKGSKAARPINTEIEVTAPSVAQYLRGDAREEPVGYSVGGFKESTQHLVSHS